MNMLVMTLQSLGESALAWGAVGLLALAAMVSILSYARCERRCAEGSLRDGRAAREYLDQRVAAGPRYLALMLSGIAAMVAGLAMIAGDMRPDLGFFILVAGIVVVQTEPLRQRIRIADARVAAAPADDADQRGLARDNLRDSHRALVVTNVALTVLVALGLLAF